MATARWYQDTFDAFYLELQEHSMPELTAVNRQLVELSRQTGIPLVATNDAHYVYQEDAPTQDILLCIGTNSSLLDEKRMRMNDDSYYLKSEEEMRALFPELPEAIENTCRIAEMCDLNLEFGDLHLPEAEVPPGKSADDYLAELSYQRAGAALSPGVGGRAAPPGLRAVRRPGDRLRQLHPGRAGTSPSSPAAAGSPWASAAAPPAASSSTAWASPTSTPWPTGWCSSAS